MTSSSRRISWTREWPLLQGCKTRRYNKTFKNALFKRTLNSGANTLVAEPMQTDNGKSVHHGRIRLVVWGACLASTCFSTTVVTLHGMAGFPAKSHVPSAIHQQRHDANTSVPFASAVLPGLFCAWLSRSDSSMPDLHSLQSRIRALQTSTPILARDAADVMRGRQVSTCYIYHANIILTAVLLRTAYVLVRVVGRMLLCFVLCTMRGAVWCSSTRTARVSM